MPVVGTGAYQAVEWKTGEHVRFVRNPNYTGPKGYQDEVFIQFFGTEAAMTEALKTGEIDYARNVTADQFDSLKGLPNIVSVESTLAAEANAFTQLNFNTYSKPIEGGGASTTALQDPLFRDALGYAIDKPALVDRVLSGHGLAGSTILPPAMANGVWHLEPANPRTFDIAVAKQKLEAAGYKLDGERQAPRQGEQADQPADARSRHRDHVRAECRVHHRLVGGTRHRRDDAVARSGRGDRPRDATGRRSARQGRLRRRHLELGGRRRSRTRCSRS